MFYFALARVNYFTNALTLIHILTTIAEIGESKCGKMKTFRMLQDERPTRHMIALEKKLGGYASVSRINTPNPSYIPPEKGGINDEILNPKKFY